MIGRWLGQLTPEEEGRVLTNALEVGPLQRCLLAVAFDATNAYQLNDKQLMRMLSMPQPAEMGGVGMIFDRLCRRFGLRRVSAAIRARILRNQLRRRLSVPRLPAPSKPVTQSAETAIV